MGRSAFVDAILNAVLSNIDIRELASSDDVYQLVADRIKKRGACLTSKPPKHMETPVG